MAERFDLELLDEDDPFEIDAQAAHLSRITDKIIADMADWVSRPLESIYAAIFIDALSVKVRDGQVANRPFYAAIGVDLAGHKDVLGLWAGDGAGESYGTSTGSFRRIRAAA